MSHYVTDFARISQPRKRTISQLPTMTIVAGATAARDAAAGPIAGTGSDNRPAEAAATPSEERGMP